MPRFTRKVISDAESAPDPILAQTQEAQMGTLRKFLGTGIRVASGVGSGIASAVPGIGSVIGAGLSAGGESLAELAEGSEQNPYRIAAEGALGAVPFGKWIGAARGAKGAVAAGRDFLAGGAAAGLGEAGREWAEGEEMNPWAIGGTTAFGGTLGAAAGSLARMLGGPSKAPKLPTVKPIETVNVPTKGGNVAVEQATPMRAGVNRFGNKAEYDDFKRAQGFTPQASRLELDPTSTVPTFQSQQPWAKTAKPHRKVLGLESKDIGRADGDAMGKFDEGIRKAADKSFRAVDALSKGRHDAAFESLDEGIKESEALAALRRKQRVGYEKDVTSFDEALTSKYGRTNPVEPPAKAASGMWNPDELDETMDWVPEAALPSKVGQWSIDELDETMPAPPQQGVGMWSYDELDETMPAVEPITALANLYKNRPDAMESAYGGMKDALHNGEMSDDVAKVSQKILGKGLGNERAAFSKANPTGGDWVTEQLKEIGRQGQLRQQTHPSFYDDGFEGLELAPKAQNQTTHPSFYDDGFDGLENANKVPNQNVHPSFYDDGFDNVPDAKAPKKGKRARSNEAGFVAPELGGAMAGGGAGALYGATQDEGPYPGKSWKNQVRNAALYGLGGAALGAGAGKVASADEWSIPAFQESAGALAKQIPNALRFNYLASVPTLNMATGAANPGGLLANAVVGPYGSAMSGGLETALASKFSGSGDKRGGQLLKQLGPTNFLKTFLESGDEAKRLIREGEQGRADYQNMGGDSNFNKMMELPGQVMTQGDTAATRMAENAGFSNPEARQMMMTSQPENAWLSSLHDGVKNSVPGQIMFPFRRTPLNTVEQGLRRLPGVGIAAQLGRGDQMDPLSDVMAQQALGLGYMGAGYVAGDNADPETAKWLRRYVTNGSGRYGMGAGMGFTMGQAHAQGKDRMKALANPMQLDNYMPLPTIDPIVDTFKMGMNALDGDDATKAVPPRGVAPPLLYDMLFPRTEKVSRFKRKL